MTQHPRAEGNARSAHNSVTNIALAPRRGGSGIGEAFARRLRNPKRRRAAPEGSTALRGELGDDSRTPTLRAGRGGG